MAALLRQGARRIVGSVLQRTKAAVTSPAVAEERRRLVTRRMYSTDENANEEITLKIQQSKDELFDLIRKGEKDDRTSTMPNAWLLPYLSRKVTPRPSDSYWRDMKSTSEAINAIKNAGILSLVLVTVDYYKDKVASGHDDGRRASNKRSGDMISPGGDGELLVKLE